MPANLTQQYHKAEQAYRQASTPEEELACLQAMLREIPKHKGTDHLQAQLKQKISKAKKEMAAPSKSGKKGRGIRIPRQGAGTAVILGGPNAGKSQLLATMTRATPEVAPYPFTTHQPAPGMMPWQDVTVQLVDTPPITPDFFESYMFGIIRGAELVLLMVDLGSDSGVEQCQDVLDRLNDSKTRLGTETYLSEEDVGLSFTRTFVVPNKIDLPEAEDRLELFHELCPVEFEEFVISAQEETGLEPLRDAIYQAMDVVRVYTKLPTSKEADRDRPFTVRRGSCLADLAGQVHKDYAEGLKFARVWGSAVHDATVVKGDYELHDQDVVELHMQLEPVPLTNADIAARLEQVADLLEFQGANPFRIRAYRNGARAIHDLAEPVEAILNDGDRKLTDIQGIGKDLAQKVADLVETGVLEILEELLEEIPESVLAMLRVPGLGPKKAAALYQELGIHTLDQLRVACETGQVQTLKGFAAKTEKAILENIDIASEADKRTYWAIADEIVQDMLAHFRECPAIERIEPAGSYRRGKETVGDLDFLALADDASAVMDHFAAYPEIQKTLLRGDTKMSVRLEVGIQVDLRVVPAESFGAAMQYFTGSQAHNVVLRGMGKAQGLKINEYGVFRGEEQIAGDDEAGVYATLDLPHFPPELREARREFDWAAEGNLPELIQLEDLRGDLHCHTTYSDGMATIEEMALAARQLGHSYLAITDHSKRVAMAGGLDEDQLLRQWEDVDKVNESLEDFQLLKGIEVDILEGGGLDLDDDVLAQGDWIVASVHYGQNQSRERITQRVVEALENPHVCALGHPTGRLLNRRKPYEIDMEAVFQAAADNGKMLELNAHPKRLDLDDVACASAQRYGVPVVISTDAHIIDGLGALRYGVLQARRGGLTKDDVGNTRTWPELKRMIGKAR